MIDKIIKIIAKQEDTKIPNTVLAEFLVKLANVHNSESAKTLTVDALNILLEYLSNKKPAFNLKHDDMNNRLDEDDKYDIHIDEDRDAAPEKIEGHCGEFEWKLYKVDVVTSNLWSEPPKDTNLYPRLAR